MKKYKIIILTNVLIVFTAFTGIAQNNDSTLDQLQASEWEMEGSTRPAHSIKYDDGHATHYRDGIKIGTDQYYLSDAIDEEFDSRKLGQVKEGKYIISRGITGFKDGVEKEVNPSGNFSVYEIKQVNKNWLMIRPSKRERILKFQAKS